uniref:Core shell protein Gag P30 domain-containing protein n=1 Tax=Malurus cyaneus samueli TaxID=2593467 RepID=A0A8C5TDA2_9PASS
MGCVSSSESIQIPREAPLSVILKHWQVLTGKRTTLNTGELVRLCTHVWPVLGLRTGRRWPQFGSLDNDLITELLIELRVQGRYEELRYAEFFAIFLNREQAYSQPKKGWFEMVLLKRKKGGETRPVTNKVAGTKETDMTDLDLVAPTLPVQTGGGAGGGGERRGKIAPEAIEASSPVAKRTRSKRDGAEQEDPALEAPLRQAVGNQGLVYIKTPFSLGELQQWKESVGRYRDNPERVAMHFVTAIKAQNPDWSDLNVMLDESLDISEKEMVTEAAIAAIETQITAGTLQGPVNYIFPLSDPGWDPNVPDQMAKLKRYQNGWSLDVNESPTDFLNRLKEAARKYTNLDLESPAQQSHLAFLFIGQSAKDIRRKLQKMDGTYDMSALLNAAWKVYQNRDSTDTQDKNHHKKKQDKGKSSNPPKKGSLADDQCVVCKKRGHWKNECPTQLKQIPPVPAVGGD